MTGRVNAVSGWLPLGALALHIPLLVAPLCCDGKMSLAWESYSWKDRSADQADRAFITKSLVGRISGSPSIVCGESNVDMGCWLGRVGWKDVVERKATFPQNFTSMTLISPESFWEEVALFSTWEMLGLSCEHVLSWLLRRLRVGLGWGDRASEASSRGLQPEHSSTPWRSIPNAISLWACSW